MSVQGKNSLSYKKKNVGKSNNPHVGFKNITFAHEFASAGETIIPFGSLSAPSAWAESGLTNPSGSSLLSANLQAFRPNVTVSSSARGFIQKEEYIVHNNRIEFKTLTSFINEVFEVEVSDIMVSGNLIVDMQTIRVEGELADTEVQFNMGYEFDVNNEEILVFRDGIQMFRSDNNESSGTTGNYYYIDLDGDGKGSVIEFFEASVGVESVLIATTGGVVDSPNTSTFQQLENLAGQLDALVPTVAALAGVPETNFQLTPNHIDLKTFGDLLLQLKADAGKVGDVKTSMLNLAQFQSLHDSTWVLMNGDDVTGSDYDDLVFAGGGGSIPDARGQFLRGKNNGRVDGQENPDGEIALGVQEGDATRNITGVINGISESFGQSGSATGAFVKGNLNLGATPVQNDVGNVGKVTFNSSNTVPTALDNRPKNVTINYFIKINA